MTKVPSTAAKLSHAPHAATKAAAKTKKPNVHAVSGDAYGFKIGSVRTTRGFPAEIGDLPGDGIQGTFPIDKLSSIKTPGRHGMGFRLDGGAVRFLWVSARRIEENTTRDRGNAGIRVAAGAAAECHHDANRRGDLQPYQGRL